MSRAALPASALGLPDTTFAGTPRGPLALIDVVPSSTTGRPVLLVPGFTGSKEDFGPVLTPLAEAGHRAVACDQRGQFESKGPDDADAYTVDLLAQDLLDLVDALGGGRWHLVGHSFGGLVSRAAVIARPSAFASLTLLDSGPAAIVGKRHGSTALLQQGAAQPDITMEAMWDAITSFYAAEGRPPIADAAAGFQRTRFTSTARACIIGTATALLAEPDRVDELAATRVPTLVTYGVDDDAWPPELQSEMAARLGATDAPIEGAAHSPAVENAPGLLAVLVPWLAAHDG
ncbi:MAG TPA: alpha/beta hydrolase [Mycobacteriales bacterium]|nr:alpha/beta hydrolase [Mycobacteriales bacterium]